MRPTKSAITIFIFVFTLQISAQELVTVDFVSNISRLSANLVAASQGINLDLDSGIDLFRVTYTTTGSDGALDLASGLLMLPDLIDRDLPVLVYQHGTTSGRSDVPSELNGGFQLGALFAGKGMIVLAPDYIGLGTSRGIHPYVHAETEATAAVDFLKAIQIFLQESEIGWNDQLFVTGYSQGGHAAMAFHNYVQEELSSEYEITASLPMSGPYDVSGTMGNLALGDEAYSFPAYIVYATLGLQAVNPNLFQNESEFFKEEYLPPIQTFIDTGEELFEMNEALISILFEQVGSSIPREMFKDSVLNAILNNDTHPLREGLRSSDLYDWTPQAPVLMLYCEDDDQVPFTNSTLADSTMNANGAPNVEARDVSGGASLDHTACIVPALNVGIPWLLGFIDRSTPVIEINDTEDLVLYPNPTQGQLSIVHNESIEQIQIYSISGSLIFSQTVGSYSHQLELGGLPEGGYLAHIFSESGLAVRKFVLAR